MSKVSITSQTSSDVQLSVQKLAQGVTQSTIRFSCQGEGYFLFRPFIHALPINFHVDNTPSSMTHVFVGQNRIDTKSLDFSIHMRDRHGMAWADLNNDQRMDVFLTRGGLRGTMRSIPLQFWDELFLSSDNGLMETGKQSGLIKRGCPGRQAAFADYNLDGLLDICVTCGRENKEEKFPNILFQQSPEGKFSDAAAKVGLDIQNYGKFLWVDSDNDGDMDFFWADWQGFTLYENNSGHFSPHPIKTNHPFGESIKLLMADFDNDVDMDIFSVSPKGNALLINNEGTYSFLQPNKIGLPLKSMTANWVDFDNDSLVDLHCVPHGIYSQTPDHTFIATSILNSKNSRFSPFRLKGARAVWFDADNDGLRDLVISTQYALKHRKFSNLQMNITNTKEKFGKLTYFWKSRLLINKNTKNHWLQLHLTGPPSNRQAIGSLVTLVTPEHKTMHQVTGLEGSHYSQGHYRQYFGLGSNSEILKISVKWPDGNLTEILNPTCDQLLEIQWEKVVRENK